MREVKNPFFSVNTNDLQSLKLLITVTKQNKPVDLSGTTARIAILKPDEKTVFQECEIVDAVNGKVAVTLENQAYIVPGTHSAELMIYGNDGLVAVTCRFTYKSVQGILDDDTVESSDEWQAIHKKVDEAQAILDDLRENGTGIDAQARTQLQVLNEKVDENHQQLSAQLAQKANKEEVRTKEVKLELEDMSPTVLAAIEGGEGTSFNLLSIPQDDSVTSEKLSPQLRSELVFPMTNAIANGDFSEGTTGWVGQYGDLSVLNNTLKQTANGTNAYPRVRYTTPLSSQGKRYAKIRVRVTNADCRVLSVRWGTSTTSEIQRVTFPVSGQWYTLAGVIDTNIPELYIYHEYLNPETAANKELEIEQAMVIDLTATFGSGKEPPQDKMEELLAVYPNSWFGGTVNLANQNKMLPYLLDKVWNVKESNSYQYPFHRNATLIGNKADNEKLLKAIKDIRLYNTDIADTYHLVAVRRKYNGNQWLLTIANSSGSWVCQFSRSDYDEPNHTEKVYLSPMNNNKTSGYIIIDWKELSEGTNWYFIPREKTLLDEKVYYGSNDKQSEIDNYRNLRPWYWKNIQDSIRKIDEKQDINTLSFNVMTDIHMEDYRTRIMTSVEAGSALAEYADLDFTVLLGDYIIGDLPKNESLKLINDIMMTTKMHSKCPVFSVKGNHDSNDQPPGWSNMSESEKLQYLITNKEYFQADTRKSLQYGIVVDENNPYGGYYYRDFERQKIRGIFLNTSEINEVDGEVQFPNYVITGVRSQKQLEWLANTALQVDDGWAVAIFMHIPPVEEEYMHFRGISVPSFNTIIQGFVNSESGVATDSATGANVAFDFTHQNDVEMIGFFCGHVHEDSHAVIDGVNVFISNCTTPKKRWDTSLEREPHGEKTLSMNTFIINRDTRTVNVVKTGTGSDFEFTW